MSRPTDVPVIDLMVGIPHEDGAWSRLYTGLVAASSAQQQVHGTGYLFKDVPAVGREAYPELLLGEMDRHGIARAMIPVSFDEPLARGMLEAHPDRFLGSWHVDPNQGMEGVRALERAVRELGVVAATAFPAGYLPQVPIDDKRFFPLYAKCVELDLPIFINAGVPGPQFLASCQDVARLDEVCWFFPDLTVVTRHGCEPWVDLAVKLMLKYPNLHFSTSGFAPKHYPKAVLEYANTRGADKLLYAGYFPSGLSLERIFTELDDLPLRDHVWPKFLHENARRVLRLDPPRLDNPREDA